jgi:hypothetical protein
MDTAYTGVLAGYLAKKLTGCKLITDTGDVAYELAKSTGNYSKAQLALINWTEQMALKNSEHIALSYGAVITKAGSKSKVFKLLTEWYLQDKSPTTNFPAIFRRWTYAFPLSLTI